MKKIILLILLVPYIKINTVETDTFSLHSKITHLIELLNKSADHSQAKKYLLTQLQLCQQQKDPEALMTQLFDSAKTIRNSGVFLTQLEAITKENIHQSFLKKNMNYDGTPIEQPKPTGNTRKFVSKLNDSAERKKTPEEIKNKAIKEVITLMIKQLE